MQYRTERQIVGEDGTIFKAGDKVMFHYKNGGGHGNVVISKITDKGFHFNAGGRDKSVLFEKVEVIEKWND